MNKYAKAIVGALGIGEMVGFPVVADSGFDTSSAWQAVVGAVTIFAIWFVKNEPILEQAVAAGKELVRVELTHPPVSTADASVIVPAAKVVTKTPLTAAERAAIADAWSKVSTVDSKPGV